MYHVVKGHTTYHTTPRVRLRNLFGAIKVHRLGNERNTPHGASHANFCRTWIVITYGLGPVSIGSLILNVCWRVGNGRKSRIMLHVCSPRPAMTQSGVFIQVILPPQWRIAQQTLTAAQPRLFSGLCRLRLIQAQFLCLRNLFPLVRIVLGTNWVVFLFRDLSSSIIHVCGKIIFY